MPCTLQCDSHCEGVIVNAKTASTLSIDCLDCDDMIIYCPQNGPHGADNTCSLHIAGDVDGLTVYAQESFHDFTIIPTESAQISSSTLHCGDLSMVEFQCNIHPEGTSCAESDDFCASYRIPTPLPTTVPTMGPTQRPTVHALDANSGETGSDLDSTSTTTPNGVSTVKVYNVNAAEEEVDVGDGAPSDLFGIDSLDKEHYALLLIGLCFTWFSCCCCALLLWCHCKGNDHRSRVGSDSKCSKGSFVSRAATTFSPRGSRGSPPSYSNVNDANPDTLAINTALARQIMNLYPVPSGTASMDFPMNPTLKSYDDFFVKIPFIFTLSFHIKINRSVLECF